MRRSCKLPIWTNAIARYIHVVAAESDRATFWGKYYGLRGALLQIPNAFFFHGLLNRLGPALSPLMPLLRFGWALIGMPIFTTVWAARWLFARGFGGCTSLSSNVYLHASNDQNMAYVPKAQGRPSAALVCPFRKKPAIGPWVDVAVDLRTLTTRGAIVRAAVASINATFRLLFSARHTQVLFTYSAPNWFWVNEALERAAPSSIWISNHYDRWAALVASLPNSHVTIVQHGQIGQHDFATGRRVIYRLDTPLSNVRRVFVTDERSVEEFKCAVTGEGPEFITIQRKLRVVPWKQESSDRFRILIIGHRFVKKTVDRLIKELSLTCPGTFAFAYRPHPTDSFPTSFPGASQEAVTMVPTDNTIPDTDAILSYASSFAEEAAEATGARLFYFDPSNFENVEAVADAIRAHRKDLLAQNT